MAKSFRRRHQQRHRKPRDVLSVRSLMFGGHLPGDTIMIRTARFTLALSLFAATAWTLGLTSSVSAQDSVKVFHKTVKIGDLRVLRRRGDINTEPDDSVHTVQRA